MFSNKKKSITSLISITTFFSGIFSANALAITIGFDTFSTSGDVFSSASSTSLSTDSTVFQDDFPSPVGTFNFSGNSPEDAQSLANFLGVPVTSLDPDFSNFILAIEGSAIQRDFTNVEANTTISFSGNFLTNENSSVDPQNDYAFVVINDQVIPFADIGDANQPSSLFEDETGVNNYSFTFSQDGDYSFAIGVLDVFDGVDSSGLSLTNLQLTPPDNGGGTTTPEPTSIISILGLGLIGLISKSSGKKAKD